MISPPKSVPSSSPVGSPAWTGSTTIAELPAAAFALVPENWIVPPEPGVSRWSNAERYVPLESLGNVPLGCR